MEEMFKVYCCRQSRQGQVKRDYDNMALQTTNTVRSSKTKHTQT